MVNGTALRNARYRFSTSILERSSMRAWPALMHSMPSKPSHHAYVRLSAITAPGLMATVASRSRATPVIGSMTTMNARGSRKRSPLRPARNQKSVIVSGSKSRPSLPGRKHQDRSYAPRRDAERCQKAAGSSMSGRMASPSVKFAINAIKSVICRAVDCSPRAKQGLCAALKSATRASCEDTRAQFRSAACWSKRPTC
jgi:hypothetical protein